MKKSIAFMIALTIVFVFASLTVAVENKETAAPAAAAPAVKPAHRQVTGDVVSVNAAANTVVVKGKKGDVMLMVNDKTKVMIGNEKKALADIKAGDKVVVRYTEADGKNTAKRIDLVLAPAAKKPAAPAEKK